jgi:hypothetical protein
VDRTAYVEKVKTLVEERIDRRWYPDRGHDLLIARSHDEGRQAEEVADAVARDIVQAISDSEV